MAREEDVSEQMEYSDDELIIRKKKQPERKTGVTAAGVLQTAAEALDALRANPNYRFPKDRMDECNI